MNNTKYGLS